MITDADLHKRLNIVRLTSIIPHVCKRSTSRAMDDITAL
jgi:pyruvoyl-dependent arginine decarboxylase (PvlArgDC)